MKGTIGPAVAGTWYPGESEALAAEVDRMLAAAPAPSRREIAAVIAPHAGYVYSGSVAAHGFRILAGCAPRRVVVLGPSHRAAFRGAALPQAGGYRTPLGEIPIDGDAVAALAGRPGFRLDDGPFRAEHCLEMELPFLQRLLAPGWTLLPVLLGGGSMGESTERVAAALRDVVDDATLLVVSTDLVHYGPSFGYVPFRDRVAERIDELDREAIRLVASVDRAGFEDYLSRTGATICGRDAIDVLLRLLPGGSRGELAAYDSSGRMTGDWSHAVSYASIVFPRTPDRPAS